MAAAGSPLPISGPILIRKGTRSPSALLDLRHQLVAGFKGSGISRACLEIALTITLQIP